MTPKEKKSIVLNYASRIYYNDHLGSISKIMELPLTVMDESMEEACKNYYPDINVQLLDFQSFSTEYLVENYDVIFMSDLWDRESFREKVAAYEKKYNKLMRSVHCPHGFSDKGFYLRKTAKEDIILVYGDNMLDQMKHYGVHKDLNQYVTTGNYRYSYYKNNKAFFDKIVDELLFKKLDKGLKNILYAPTWADTENSTTFFEHYSAILDQVPDHFNLIVKPHPRLELDNTAQYYQIMGKYHHKDNIAFISESPLVYPFLDKIDIYLGDMSSIGYDFLSFNRPMFFLNKKDLDLETDRRLYLFRCGTQIKSSDFDKLYSIIDSQLENDMERFDQVRKQVYRYTFGNERPFAEIKKDIIEAYNSPPHK